MKTSSFLKTSYRKKSFCRKSGISLHQTDQFGRGFFVESNPIKAGTTIWKEKPLCHALKSNVCHFCWKQPSNGHLYRCGKCKFARYCSKECQSADWKQSHKIRCKAISKLKGRIPTPTVLAVAELLFLQNQCNSDYKPSSTPSRHELQLSLISKLETHWNQKSKDQQMEIQQVSICIALYLKSLQNSVKSKGSNTKNPLDLDQIHQILSAFTINAMTICDDEFNPLGIGLFPIASILNHSCDPNVSIRFNPRSKSAEIRTLRDIQCGEQLFINYTDITVPRFMRQRILQSDYHFECQCTLCRQSTDNESIESDHGIRTLSVVDSNSSRQSHRENELLCLEVICPGCGDSVFPDSSEFTECINPECNAQCTLKERVNAMEREYIGIKRDSERAQSEKEQKLVLKRCNKCLNAMDKVIGKYHWLRIGMLKVIERVQMNLKEYRGCYESNMVILEFYEKWLNEDSPYLGIQYILTAKLLKHLVHDKWDEIARFEQHLGDDAQSEENEARRKEVFIMCKKAEMWFEKGLQILRVSHRDSPLLDEIQKSMNVLQNIESFVCNVN